MDRRALGTVVAAVVAALAVGGWLALRAGNPYHEHVGGAQGAFPTALGSGAPAAPDRVLRRTSQSYGVDGGLSVDETDDGVAAHDLRTGKEYWHYGRSGTELGTVGLTGSGGTVATWWKDGTVVGTDVRTGKPRWHAKVTYGKPAGSSDTFAALDVVSGLVVVESRDAITAFAEDSGKRVWRGAVPKGCRLSSGGVFAMRGAVVARAECAGTGKAGDDLPLIAFDTRRGTVRWKVDSGLNRLRPVDDHTLVTSLWTRDGIGAVVDVSGRTPRVTTWPVPALHPTEAAGDGIMLCADNTAGSSDGTLVAYDVADRTKHWTRRPAKDTRLGPPLIEDGRVYVVQQPLLPRSGTPKAVASDLLVLDARTGRQLHSTRLPPVRPASGETGDTFAALTPWQAVDGVVAVQWTGMFSGTDDDLLVLAQ
ncbi:MULTISPECIES: PQQ-binding-like beta-propeller repeat protein [unclassified Streptomyces]|uniref:outer membrane protein assembly factor BamB family protein n=1 Tax=unclassified Streptomyces TaxID=2593676 RepID=UPI00344C4C89